MRDALEIEVDQWMRQFAAIDARDHALPDPSVIWLKAKLFRSANEVQRATRPLALFEIAAQAVVAACWAAMVTWKWDAIAAWIKGMTPREVLSGAAATSSVSLPFLMTLAILGVATVMVAMHSVFAEE